jgi:hypothetical protein
MDMEALEPESESEFIRKKWYVVVDDVVGGWAISSIEKPVSLMDYNKFERRWIVADGKEIANHIAELHNRSLE